MSVRIPTTPSGGENQNLLDTFERELEVVYREEKYLVRDNGAVFRRNIYRKRARPLDKKWTFGRQNPSVGYMHLAGVPVHRIVCTAFHGHPQNEQNIVDHIDTNRANNRAENLRWVSRLENVLLNPISARRIELAYGSLEAFFENPKRVQGATKSSDISWMRTVSKEQAQRTKLQLEKWAQSASVPSGGALGEWLYGTRERADFEPESEEYESLTPSVVQVKWKVPSEFPACPISVSEEALDEYAKKLKFGAVFVRNECYHGLVVQCKRTEDGLVVLSHSPNNVKDWAVAHISLSGEFYYVRSMGTYYDLQGALKQFCELTGVSYDECFDDYC